MHPKKTSQLSCQLACTLQEENFQWNLNFAISLMASSLNFKFRLLLHYVFGNLSMTAYIIEIQKSKFTHI